MTREERVDHSIGQLDTVARELEREIKLLRDAREVSERCLDAANREIANLRASVAQLKAEAERRRCASCQEPLPSHGYNRVDCDDNTSWCRTCYFVRLGREQAEAKQEAEGTKEDGVIIGEFCPPAAGHTVTVYGRPVDFTTGKYVAFEWIRDPDTAGKPWTREPGGQVVLVEPLAKELHEVGGDRCHQPLRLTLNTGLWIIDRGCLGRVVRLDRRA